MSITDKFDRELEGAITAAPSTVSRLRLLASQAWIHEHLYIIVLGMSGVIKQSTRLTGLAVSKNPHRELGVLYSKILNLLEQLPKDYAYRRYTEKIVQERSSILEEYNDIAVVEEKIGCGQIEEVIMQAKYEINLAEKMQQWRPWEGLVQEAPPNQWTWPPHK